MRSPVVLILLVASSFLLASCGLNVISHAPSSAAESAERFAEAAFVRGDYGSAYDDLSPQMRQAFSVGKLTAEVAKVHPGSRPTEVNAIEFEPQRGQRAMNIYLNGSGGGEEFHYRLLMVGTKGSGYKVSGFWRGSGPYPPSARKPL